jgi:glycosyltransferase involved in cell wall biosynthesis
VTELLRAGVSRGRVHLVPNAWDDSTAPLARSVARKTLGIGDDTFLVGWVGRLSHEKGPDVLLDAAQTLSADAGIRFSIIGDGPQRERLQQRAAAAGGAEQIHWHGSRPDAATLFSAFDVFVLSSRTEGTPMVLFEAMAAQTPVIATEVGGVPDVLSSAQALLVPSEDAHALARAIQSVRADADAARARATAAFQRLRTEYTMSACLARYEAIYGTIRSLRGRS